MKLNSTFAGTTHLAWWYFLLVIVLPVMSLMLLGLAYLWEHNGLLAVTAGWLSATIVGFALIHWKSRSVATLLKAASSQSDSATEPDVTPEQTLPSQLDTPSYWSSEDIRLWDHYCEVVNTLVADKPPWDELPTVSVQLLANIANDYQLPQSTGPSENNMYRFTLPEALQVLAVASTRYRLLLIEHIPFAERVTVSSMLGFYKHKSNLKASWGWFNKTRRIWRLTNPLVAAVGELRDQFTNRLFETFSDKLQNDLKRLLLQEVVQAGIDLYSGGLKFTDEEMQTFKSRTQLQDQLQPALAQEPMRIVLLGQTGAGKSSLVNAMIKGIEAEVDHLPATNSLRTHVLTIDESIGEPDPSTSGPSQNIHLIDTPGFGTSKKTDKLLVDNACGADLILFVARANQPARSSDKQIMDLIHGKFSSVPLRRQPPMVLALTHVDQLSPRSEWAPPYDLNSNQGKAKTIAQALDSARSQIGLPAQCVAIPLCVSQDMSPYNVEAIVAQILMLREEAIHTQFNRRRIERSEQSIIWYEQWNTLVRLGRAAGRVVSRR